MVDNRVSMMGCSIDNLSMEETIATIDGFIRDGRPHQHVVINVDKIVKAYRDPALMDVINACDLINVDGMPVVWAARLLGIPLKERIAGIDLFEALMQRAAIKGWRVFLLGARDEIISSVCRIYIDRYPGLVIAGHRNGYWPADQDLLVAEQVFQSKADLLFVAISSPRKEKFLNSCQDLMRVPFAMGVGGTFDVAAGKVKRAPLWMQKVGLEWFFRFMQEPKRMFRRYFIEDIYFVRIFIEEWRRR